MQLWQQRFCVPPATIASRSRSSSVPPWPEIYGTDAERRQSIGTAARICNGMVMTYSDLGYEPIEVPRASIEARVRFVSNVTTPALEANR